MSKRNGKNAFWRFLEKLHNPPNWVAVIAIATTLVVCPLTILAVWIDYGHTVYAIIAGFICLIMVTYTVVVTVNSAIKIRKKVLKVADRYEFTRNLSKSYEFRTIFFAICAVLCNIAYTVFLIVTAFIYRSVWYGAIGIYYILLTVTRGGALLQNRSDEKKYKYDFQRLQEAKVGTYRYCGIMMLALALSLIVSVVELVIESSGFRRSVWLIPVFAVVAAYKVVYAVIHFVRATKRDDLVVRSVRYINLAATLMSLLCLQTSILAVCPLTAAAIAIVNGVTGAIVCLSTLALGVFMVVFSVKTKHKLLAEEAILVETAETWDGVGYNRDGYVEEYMEIQRNKEK